MLTSVVFDHDKLNVYQKTLEFVTWVSLLLEHVPKSAAAYNQLDRASTSLALNIAEGTGKFTARIAVVIAIRRADPRSIVPPVWMCWWRSQSCRVLRSVPAKSCCDRSSRCWWD